MLLLATLGGLAQSVGLGAPGAVDLSYNPRVLSTPGFVYTTVELPNGQRLIGGDFTSVGGVVRESITRLNADGSVDRSFVTKMGTRSGGHDVNCMAVQPDGKILIGGGFQQVNGSAVSASTGLNHFARLNADGTLDTGFNAGLGGANARVTSILVQPDGKVLIAGSFSQVNGSVINTTTGINYIARLNADGTLDTTFNRSAGVGLGGANNSVIGMALQPDGKIVIGGLFTAVNGTPVSYLARLNANGTLDAGFSSGGGFNGAVRSVVVQPDGKVVAVGQFTSVGGSAVDAVTGINRIVRLNANGSVDASFNRSGGVGLGGCNGVVITAALQLDGKLLLSGSFTSVNGTVANRVARLNTDGTLDAVFHGAGGIGQGGADAQVSGISSQADGRVLLYGSTGITLVNGVPRSLFARLESEASVELLTAPDTTQVLWSRSGSGPEVGQVSFAQSVDGGATWAELGNGVRVGTTANWQLTGLSLPASGLIRVRGQSRSGGGGGSSGIVETVSSLTAPTITSASPALVSAVPGRTVTLTGTGFYGASAVTISGVAVASFTVVSDTELRLVMPAGLTGTVNVVVTNAVGTATAAGAVSIAPQFGEFVDPNPNPGNAFGTVVLPLSTGNVVVTSPYDDAGGTDAGAVYLFNGASGALISTLRGSSASDQVGLHGVTQVGGGNYVIFSGTWNNGGVAGAGAVTFGNGVTGVSGVVSAANSLVGTQDGDGVGALGVTVLRTGNYVVDVRLWNGAVGAMTFGSGATGVSGPVSAANSLIGCGAARIVELANGNYVVTSQYWDNGGVEQVGAVTWGSGMTGVSGQVSTGNSLVGTTTRDYVGSTGVEALTNGNYLVLSASWSNKKGAVTLCDGAAGTVGEVNASNSLVGVTPNDWVGSGQAFALADGAYVVCSPRWDANRGAATFGNGIVGPVGPVSAANSLVGTQPGDEVALNKVVAFSNGNYVVRSGNWNNGGIAGAGALTFGRAGTGIVGEVTAANSLVGTTDLDRVGGGEVKELKNGNYVVCSPQWDNGAVVDAGAVTFCSGASGRSGPITSAGSVVGSTANDAVGNGGVTALSNGNYVVRSPNWDNGAIVDAGAVSFFRGTGAVSGPLSSANSLVGSTVTDRVGANPIVELANDNYLVATPLWDNGAVVNAGALTWASGLTGIAGVVSAANSLIGTSPNDQVGTPTPLRDGNYLVATSNWDNGAVPGVGALTWANGATGLTGPVTVANSLIGSQASDNVGATALALSNGGWVVSNRFWQHGVLSRAGAATFGAGGSALVGQVSSVNSAVGLKSNAFLVGPVADDVNGTIFASFSGEGGGRVRVGSQVTGFPVILFPEIVVEQPLSTGLVDDSGSVSFGSLTTGVAGAPVTFTVRNSGAANLTLGTFTKDGAAPGDFAISAPGSLTVAPGGSTTFTVTFTPGASGARSATLHIPSNDVDEDSFEISLTGTGASGSGGAGALAFESDLIHVLEEAGVVQIPIVRTGGSAGAVSVTFSALRGTATSPRDFTAIANQVVNFADGEVMKTVAVSFVADAVVTEINEIISLRLASPAGGAALGRSTATVVISEPESTPPTVAILKPSAGSKVPEGMVIASGQANDNKGLEKVEISLNGGAFVEATLVLVNSSTRLFGSWSASITPTVGTNTLRARSTDLRGLVSNLATRTFTYVNLRPLTLTVSPALGGSVTFTPALVGGQAEVGVTYTLKATAKTGYFWHEWTAPGVTGTAAQSPTLSVVMSPGLAITANFVTNEFRVGTYTGLAQATGTTTPGQNNLGLFSGTLATTGKLTGKVTFGGTATSFVATFDKITGDAAGSAATLAYDLHLDLTGSTDKITGTVTQIGSGDVSAVDADHATFNVANRVPAPYLKPGDSTKGGVYTVVFPSLPTQSGLTSDEYPGGDGFGTVTLTPVGLATLVGTMADGTAVTGSAPLSKTYEWPLAAFVKSTATVTGMTLGGVVKFDPAQANSDLSAEDVQWFRPARAAAAQYPAGWPNGIFVHAVGAHYDNTRTFEGRLGLGSANPGNGQLVFAGGGLTEEVVKTNFKIVGNVVTKIPTTDTSYTLSVVQSSGAFSGTFTPNWATPIVTKPSFKGIILQKGESQGGYGFFLNNGTGAANEQAGGVTLGAP